MAILEREGYISHPHTSAGRIPTDKGYRYYVDVLAPRVASAPKRRRRSSATSTGAFSALDELLERTSQLLSELTDYTSLAASPSAHERPAAPRRARAARLPSAAAGLRRRRRLARRPPDRARVRVADTLLDDAVRLANSAVERLDAARGGAARSRTSTLPPRSASVLQGIARGAACRSTARRAVSTPAGRRSSSCGSRSTPRSACSSCSRRAKREPCSRRRRRNAVTVRIGRELALDDVRDLSLIATGYTLGNRSGALGVLGPTRMDYPSVIVDRRRGRVDALPRAAPARTVTRLMADDYYEVLGVAADASADEIKTAFRTLAREHHPDATGGDPASEQRYKEISEAYAVLSDPNKRQQYDNARLGVGSWSSPWGSPFASHDRGHLRDVLRRRRRDAHAAAHARARRRIVRDRSSSCRSRRSCSARSARSSSSATSRARRARARAPTPGTNPEQCSTLRGNRSGAAGAADDPRLDGDGVSVRRRATRPAGSFRDPCKDCRGAGRIAKRGRGAARRPGRARQRRPDAAGRRRRRPGLSGGPRGDLYVRFARRRRTSASSGTATTCSRGPTSR